ncbi:MAG: glycosyltransferase [Colwellia sp.]|nr:glycosyltransferase [Colwellia sp.]
MKSALIITSEYLGSANEIGSHQIAKQLAAKGIKTLVISFPMSPFYRLIQKRTDYNQRVFFTKKTIEVEKNLFVYIPKTVLPPLPFIVNKAPFYLNLWDKFSLSWQKVLPTNTFDFVFCESLFFPRLLQQVSYKKLVVRLPDNFSGFWKKNKTLLNAEKKLLQSADIIVTPSKLRAIELNKEHKQKRVLHLNNGVDTALYTNDYEKPSSYKKSQFNAVYVGAISAWFDMNMLFEIATLKPNWQFTIIGKSPQVSAPSNIRFIGEKRGNDKIPYLKYANVGIIPFNNQEHHALINYVNPIKMYEYLAAGIPVISTAWAELTLINAPIELAKDIDSFVAHLSKMETSTTPKAPLIEFAEKFNWKTITQQLLTEIANEKY